MRNCYAKPPNTREIEPNSDGVLTVTCFCGLKLARHIHQTTPKDSAVYGAECTCGKWLHFFACQDGRYMHGSLPSNPMDLGRRSVMKHYGGSTPEPGSSCP